MSNYKTCKDCPYYYGEIDNCMFGEPDIPDNLKRKCKGGNGIMKKRGMLGLLFDFVMVFLTGGLWLIWLLIRYLRQS